MLPAGSGKASSRVIASALALPCPMMVSSVAEVLTGKNTKRRFLCWWLLCLLGADVQYLLLPA